MDKAVARRLMGSRVLQATGALAPKYRRERWLVVVVVVDQD
jgi:hypothetical protein